MYFYFKRYCVEHNIEKKRLHQKKDVESVFKGIAKFIKFLKSVNHRSNSTCAVIVVL